MKILISWLIADFISGIVHWYEDRAMIKSSRVKFLNEVREDNERHHQQPGFLIRHTWWQNINTTAPFAWALAIVFYFSGCSLFIWLPTLFLGFGNLVHRWSHDRPNKLHPVIRLLQKTGIFISASHHSGHHYANAKIVSREGSQIRFCVMSNWLNPILDRIKFFKFLEWTFWHNR